LHVFEVFKETEAAVDLKFSCLLCPITCLTHFYGTSGYRTDSKSLKTSNAANQTSLKLQTTNAVNQNSKHKLLKKNTGMFQYLRYVRINKKLLRSVPELKIFLSDPDP
jgi:peptide subunit release factor RF-3